MNERVPDSSGLPLRAMVMVLLFLGVIFLLVGFQAMSSSNDGAEDTSTRTLTTTSKPAAPKPAKSEAAASAKFADESPAPTIADISTDVYWETDNNTPASKIGRHFFND